MTLTKGHGIIAAVVVLIFAAILSAYVAERVDRAKAEAEARAKDEIVAQLEKDKQQRDKDLAETIAGFEAELRAIKTAPQATKVIERLVPATQGQAMEVKREDLPAAVAAKLPESPGYVMRTDAAEVLLAQSQVKCAEDRASLSTCRANLDSTEKQRKAAEEKAEAWKRDARGGGFFARLKRNVKWFVIGGATGAAMAYAARR